MTFIWTFPNECYSSWLLALIVLNFHPSIFICIDTVFCINVLPFLMSHPLISFCFKRFFLKNIFVVLSFFSIKRFLNVFNFSKISTFHVFLLNSLFLYCFRFFCLSRLEVTRKCSKSLKGTVYFSFEKRSSLCIKCETTSIYYRNFPRWKVDVRLNNFKFAFLAEIKLQIRQASL